MNKSQEMIFYLNQDFSGKGVVKGVCVFGVAPVTTVTTVKNLGLNKKSSQDWGHNSGQVYAILCFQGQYIGWKSILHPDPLCIVVKKNM